MIPRKSYLLRRAAKLVETGPQTFDELAFELYRVRPRECSLRRQEAMRVSIKRLIYRLRAVFRAELGGNWIVYDRARETWRLKEKGGRPDSPPAALSQPNYDGVGAGSSP